MRPAGRGMKHLSRRAPVPKVPIAKPEGPCPAPADGDILRAWEAWIHPRTAPWWSASTDRRTRSSRCTGRRRRPADSEPTSSSCSQWRRRPATRWSRLSAADSSGSSAGSFLTGPGCRRAVRWSGGTLRLFCCAPARTRDCSYSGRASTSPQALLRQYHRLALRRQRALRGRDLRRPARVGGVGRGGCHGGGQRPGEPGG
jgi:hypothetical protein